MKKNSEDYQYYLIDQLPKKEDLSVEDFDIDKPNFIRSFGCKVEVAYQKLSENGFKVKFCGESPDDNSYIDLLCEVQFTIDSKICRAVAKVGLNYFIYWNGASIAFLPDFDPIREFIRYGTKMKLPYFQIVEKPILEGEPIEGKRRLGHLITVNWADDKSSVLAQISLFNLNTYAVCLSHQFSGPKPNIRKGHFFNVGNSKIYELGAREINAGGKIQ